MSVKLVADLVAQSLATDTTTLTIDELTAILQTTDWTTADSPSHQFEMRYAVTDGGILNDVNMAELHHVTADLERVEIHMKNGDLVKVFYNRGEYIQ